MARGLTPKQEAFALATLQAPNQSAAYRMAYDAGNMSAPAVHVEASRLIDNPRVALRVDELRSAVVERAEADAIWTREGCLRDLRDVFEGAMAAGKFDPAARCVELAGREHGLFTKKTVVAHMDAGQLASLAEEHGLDEATLADTYARINGKAPPTLIDQESVE